MLSRIIQYSLQNRLFVVIAAVLLTVTGVWTATRMEVDVFPDLNAPTVVVMTEAQGMASEEVEKLVTFPVESSLNGATGVRRVRSTSTPGFSVVWVEFDWGTDIYIARQIVSEKLTALAEVFPEGVSAPVLGPQSSILGEILIVGLTSENHSPEELRTLADVGMRPRLLSVSGVAQVAVIGGEIREYQILLDQAKMRLYGISHDEVIAAAQEMNRNSPGGVLYEYGNEYIIRGMLATTDVERMGKGLVAIKNGAPVLLEDIAEVKVGHHTPQLGLASVRGEPAVLLTVTKQPHTGTIELTERLDAELAQIASTLPSGVEMSTDIFRQSRFIDASIGNIRQALLEGALFVVIILFLFLMNGRVTVISLVALPLSLLMSVLVLKVLGITLNTMTLGGMAIAVGSLVDDAIIDVENVFKRLKQNRVLPPGEKKPALEVIFHASTEIRSSIVQATLITIVAFLPLFFLDGMEGRMLRPLGLAFIVSLFCSLIVAVTLTPVMCSYLITTDKVLARGEKPSPVASWLGKWYHAALVWVLKHKRILVCSVAGLFLVAAGMFLTLGSSFLPPFNEGSLTINVNSMPGISLEESDRIGRTVEQILLEVPEIQTVARKTGRAELDEHALGVNASEIEAPFELDKRKRAEFLADVRERLGALKGVSIEIGQPISHRIDAMLSGTKANIAIKLFGTDLNKMYSLGKQIQTAVADVPGLADVNVEQQVETPQIQIKPRREMLARYGITLPEFSEFIAVELSGLVVSQVYDGGAVFDLVVKAGDKDRNSIGRINDLLIDTGQGYKVPLSYVADIVSSSGPNTINRENVWRKIVVSANVTGGDLTGAVHEIQSRIKEKIVLPEGYRIEYGGQFESQQKASRTLLMVSLIALLVIFMLLFQEFRTVKLSSMVLLNLPLAMIGGVVILFFGSGVVSIPAIIGFISLLGIAVRNGILLVSRYEALGQQGMALRERVVKGSMDRLNPILMTTFTSALALVPLALGSDVPGNEIQSPMAKVILGGLLSSMVLNGFLLPVMYIYLNRKKA